MMFILRNITLRNIIILLFGISVMERTEISVMAEIVSWLDTNDKENLLSTGQDDAGQEAENTTEKVPKQPWEAISGLDIMPLIVNESCSYTMVSSNYYDSFCLSVPTPPPDGRMI